MYFNQLPQIISKLKEMENDELIEISNQKITVTEKGKPYVRNVCMAFDVRLNENLPQTQLFSMTI